MSLPAGRSPARLALRRFAKNRRAIVCLALLALLGAAVLLVPLLSSHPFDRPDWDRLDAPPDGSHWFGTDTLGRDLLVRCFMGGRVSFSVGLLATAVAVFIGTLYGATAGTLGGKTDMIMMRIVDILYGLPFMLIVVIIMAVLESRSFLLVFLVLGCFSWLTMSRVVRGQVLSLREREYVEAARALGARTPGIILRHMIPNMLGPIIVYATLTVPAVMLSEAFLSFLGLGISEPMTSWGVLIKEGADTLSSGSDIAWWLTLFPGLLFALTLYGLNTVGDAVRDAFDTSGPGS